MSGNQNDIALIIEGCKKGDRLAQEKLYRSFYGTMMNICLRYTKNETDAMHVMNEGFFKVFKNIHAFSSSKAAPYTWIRTVIINTCLNFIRAKQNQANAGDIGDADSVYMQPGVSATFTCEEILQMVRRLPPATQAVFNLYAIDGYTHKQIAAMLKISEGTSKWHLSEARKTLQKQLKDYM